MLAVGVPVTEIHKFADPAHWLAYFPPLCKDGTNLLTSQSPGANYFFDKISLPSVLGLIGDALW